MNLLAIERIGQHWRDKNYALRKEALDQAAFEFRLSKSSFELAMDWIFAHWTVERLEGLIGKSPLHPPLAKGGIHSDKSCERKVVDGFNDLCAEVPPFAKGGCRGDFTYSAPLIQILSGTTPAMIAQGFLQGALLDIPQRIKLPRQQTTFGKLLHQSFCELAPELSALFTVDDGKNSDELNELYAALKKANTIIAYGSDETMLTIQSHLSPTAHFIVHGHAESAAIIFKEAATSENLEKLAYDMLSYDQRGCLSPRVVFIESGGDLLGNLTPNECAQQLAEIILPKIAKKLPRGGLFEGEAEEILHQRMLYAFRGKVYTGSDWTVCFDEKLIWPTESLPRFLSLKPFNVLDDLTNLFSHIPLISIGYAGANPDTQALLKKFTRLLVPLGDMQKQLLLF